MYLRHAKGLRFFSEEAYSYGTESYWGSSEGTEWYSYHTSDSNKKFWEELIRLLSLHVIYLKYLNQI
jgi:hypothetical protein